MPGFPFMTISDAQPVTEPAAAGDPTIDATFLVSLPGPSSQQVTVHYATANGSAEAGIDYVPTEGTLTFAPGVIAQTVNVEILGDNINEGTEYFSVNLSDPVNAGIAKGVGLGTILDQDAAPGAGNAPQDCRHVITDFHPHPGMERAGIGFDRWLYDDHTFVGNSVGGIVKGLTGSADGHVAQSNPGEPSTVSLLHAAVEHMNPVAREHLPEHLQCTPPVVGDFDGATINYSYGFASPPAGFHFEEDLTVGPGIETSFPAPGFVPSVGYLDLSGASATITFTQNASFGGIFNSFTLSDLYNQVPDITGVTLVNNGGSASGLSQSDITFDANDVTVNLLGTNFAAGTEVVLNFAFAPMQQADSGLLLHV